MTSAPLPSRSPPALDPPFRGYVGTTFDALLVFEAARRGMIPRVTRRLMDQERVMVQSGAVFVFDEHESGIKRWTDGFVWSPSRILGNFLVYRETDKKAADGKTSTTKGSSSPSQTSPTGLHSNPLSSSTSLTPPAPLMTLPGETAPLGQGALRPRSLSDAGIMDRQMERQLVGSLTNSYKFKENGLVKKTMSVTVNGFSQHLISYYTLRDVIEGRLRTPSTIPELASLEISAEYLHRQNFRFPPQIEIGPDGVPRYRGEPEEPKSPAVAGNVPLSAGGGGGDVFDYNQMTQAMRLDPGPSVPRNLTVPMAIPISPSGSNPPYAAPGSAGSAGYFGEMSPLAQSHVRPGGVGPLRPNSSRSGRYDPYGATSPRSNSASLQHQARRMSGGQSEPAAYYPYDVRPAPGPSGQLQYHEYNYFTSAPPPHPAAASPVQSPATYSHAQYAGWQASTPSRAGSNVPRHVSNPISAGDPNSAISGGQPSGSSTGTGSVQAQQSNGSPSSVFQAPAPPPHDWSTTPLAVWDPQGHLHGPGHYQPHPPPTQSHYQAPAPPPDWRDGASMAS